MITSLLKRLLPVSARQQLKRHYETTRYRGNTVECTCCGGTFSMFLPNDKRPHARCPQCGSLERHRLLWMYLKEKTDFFTAKLKVLHLAPEPLLQEKFKLLSNLDYLSADLESPLAMVKMDVTNIQYPDNTFDVILCSHVLEHVPDDRKGMRELRRVLKPTGWAILQSPVDTNRAETFEDPSVVTPEDRLRVFGQSDHVRIYGRDYTDRLRETDWKLELDSYVRTLPQETITRYGLMADEDIYFCKKQ